MALLYIMTVIGKKLRLFEAFAGMGAQRKALDNIGKDYEVVGMAEWFVPAIITYQAIHNKNFALDKKTSREDMISFLESKTLSMTSKEPVKPGYWKKTNEKDLRLIFSAVKASENEGNIFDVRTLFERKVNGKVVALKGIDLLTYSFPCQDLSQQGVQKGMAKGSGTRSGLLWEIEKALEATKLNDRPKYLLMENVTALLNSSNKNDLTAWKSKLNELGYENDINILNAADFGSAQARKRAFMISTLKCSEIVKLPVGKKKPKAIKTILDEKSSLSDYITKLEQYKYNDFSDCTKSNIRKTKLIGYTSFNSEAYIYDMNFTGPTLTASGANSRIKFLYKGKIRKLNAREAYRYMGFETQDYDNVAKYNYLSSDKMIYTCGNSISVEVLEAIFEKIK